MTVKPVFTWTRFWVGVRLDRPRCRVYFYPIPMFGIVIQFEDLNNASD